MTCETFLLSCRTSFMSHLVVGSNQINWKLKWTTCAPVISLLLCFGGFVPHKCSSLAISLTKTLVKCDYFPCHNWWYLKFGSTTKEWSLNIVEFWNDKSRLHPILFGNKLMFGPWHAQLKFQFRQLGCCKYLNCNSNVNDYFPNDQNRKIKHITYRRWMAQALKGTSYSRMTSPHLRWWINLSEIPLFSSGIILPVHQHIVDVSFLCLFP